MAVDEAKVAEIRSASSYTLKGSYLIFFYIDKLQERDEHIRESWVKAMEVRLVANELAKCHKAEGVNHYENCAWLSEKYMAMLKENRVRAI